MRLLGHVHGVGVLEHVGLEREPGEGADPRDDGFRIADELLVAHLVVPSGARRAARAARASETSFAQRHANCAGVVGCAQVRVNVPSGISRNESAASRPSRTRWTYCASGKSRSSSPRWRMYIGVLSPQRGLPARSAYASKIAAIASPVAIPWSDARRDVLRPEAPRPDGGDPRDVVEETLARRRSGRAAVRGAARRTTRRGSRCPASGRGSPAGASSPSGSRRERRAAAGSLGCGRDDVDSRAGGSPADGDVQRVGARRLRRAEDENLRAGRRRASRRRASGTTRRR